MLPQTSATEDPHSTIQNPAPARSKAHISGILHGLATPPTGAHRCRYGRLAGGWCEAFEEFVELSQFGVVQGLCCWCSHVVCDPTEDIAEQVLCGRRGFYVNAAPVVVPADATDQSFGLEGDEDFGEGGC